MALGKIVFKAVSLAVPENAFRGFLNYIKSSHEKRKTEPSSRDGWILSLFPGGIYC